MKLSLPRKGDNASMAVIEYVDRPGEIRAARPPKARRERLLASISAQNELGVSVTDELTEGEADLLTEDAQAEKSK